jgi:hypothetical protein
MGDESDSFAEGTSMTGRNRLAGVLVVAAAVALSRPARGELVHRYSFTDGAKDSAGKVDGTLKGAAQVADGKLTLENGEKTSEDATVAYVEFAEPILPKQGSATVVVWFTGKESGQFARLLDVGGKDGTEGQSFVYLTPRTADDATRAAISATDTASKANVDGDRTDDGKPHMLALVIDAAAKKLRLFVDGKAAGTPADLGDNTLDKVKHAHVWVGRSGFDADTALSATVDELRVYDEAITAEKAAELFKAGPDAPTSGK